MSSVITSNIIESQIWQPRPLPLWLKFLFPRWDMRRRKKAAVAHLRRQIPCIVACARHLFLLYKAQDLSVDERGRKTLKVREPVSGLGLNDDEVREALKMVYGYEFIWICEVSNGQLYLTVNNEIGLLNG